MIFMFLAITLLIRRFIILPLLLDKNFEKDPTKCEEAIFEYIPLATFLIAVMIDTYRFYIINQSPNKVTKLFYHILL